MRLKTFTFFKLMTSVFLTLFFTLTLQAATIYVGPGGNDNNSGLSSSSAFLTIQKAVEYAASNGGPTSNDVILQEGSWSKQVIKEVSACDSWTSNLLIKGEHSNVQLNVENYCKRLTFKGFKTTRMKMFRPGDYCRLEDIRGVHQSWWEITASHITYLRCIATDDFYTNGDLIRIAAEDHDPDKVPVDILFEECCFKGSSTPDGDHIDVIQIMGVSGFTMRNCIVYNAPTGLIMPTSINGVPLEHFTLEDCYFGNSKLYTGQVDYTVTNCDFAGIVMHSTNNVCVWTDNRIRYLDQGVADCADCIFENNIIKKVGYEDGHRITLPPNNTHDPDLVIPEPDYPAASIDEQAPSVPDGLATGVITGISVELNWNASTDDYGVSGYKIYTDGANPISVTETTTTIYGLSPQTQYSFTVSAFDGSGNESEQSAATQATTEENNIIAKASADIKSGDAPLTVNFTGSASGGNASAGGFVAPGGEFVIEAENFMRSLTNSDVTNWEVSTSLSGYEGSGYITTPDNGASGPGWGNACEVQYDIEVYAAGTYNIWMLRNAPDNAGNSAFVGIDGTQLSENDNENDVNGWYWADLGSVSINAGLHIFSIQRREDGYNIDKIILTTSSTSPSGNTQAESSISLAYTFNWDFGDGNSSTEQNPTHIYSTLGTYDAVFSVSDGTDTEQDNITITVGNPAGDTEEPTVPANLTAGTITETTVDLSWDAATDNVGVTGYKVFTDGANPVSVTGTSTTIDGLSQATQYSLTVSAIDAAGNESAQSSAIQATTLDTETPTTPANLTAGTITETTVDLSWDAASDNVGITGYKVYIDGANPVSVTATSTTISGLTQATQYSFSVIAVDAAGNESAHSNTVEATTQSATTHVFGIGGTDENDNYGANTSFTMYPNPNPGDMLYLNIEGFDSNAMFQIYDMNGRMLSHKKLISNENAIDVSKLSKGMYIISVESTRNSIMKKLIIK